MSPTPAADEPVAPAGGLPVYLTVDDVARMLQVAPKTVYALVKADPTLPAVKLGGSVRFHPERLERWLRAREQGRAARPMRRPVLSVAKPAPPKDPGHA